MSTNFDFGYNVHDYAPDGKHGKDAKAFNPVHEINEPITIDWLVSEVKTRIKEITNFVRLEGTLISYKDDDKSTARNRNNGTALSTLKPENMTFERRNLKIIAARKVNGKFGEQVQVKVSYAGQLWLWYQNITKDNTILTFLVQHFSADETTWAGRECLLYLEQDEFDLRNRPKCELGEEPKQQRRK